ncbi:site-specific integrase [Janthinobacterium sp. EB271-G4-7A]|uniref:site-specific integrase n=1 Tax=Janthinobacterium sp. EB271-G4-7A TaxID=2775056 RepID=UPI001E41C13E|nr:site-specific integrase [Janthinobacterium sp. EB271-G4-7A]MCC7697073.1 site-specific integrase [Janthinobacterium sp. EB271-G4-7A]
MATIVERPRKNKSSTWQATIRVKGQAPVTKTFNTRHDAETFAQTVEERLKALVIQSGKRIKRAQSREASVASLMDERLRDIVIAYCASSESLPRHRASSPTILTTIGNVTLRELTPLWNKSYIQRMRNKQTRVGNTFTYSTIGVHFQIMSIACRWRAENLNLPAPHVNLTKKYFPKQWENRRTRRLSAEEQILIESILSNIDAPSKNQWLHLMRMALETGARLQELVLAEWTEFDLNKKVWTIPASHTKCKKVRAVPLSNAALNYMQNLQREAIPDNHRIFHHLGRPISVSAGFHKYVLKAGLIDFRFHDLRHEAISRMVLHKRLLSVFEIMAIVGHTELSMLVRYANLRGDELASRME